MASRRVPPPVPRTPGAVATEKKYVKSTWEYKANEPGELSFSVGEIIEVVTEDPSGWWIGEINGIKGQFPLNFTEPCAAPAEKVAPPIAPKPTKLQPVSTPSTESPSVPKPNIPMGMPMGNMSELKAKLANRSTVAPGDMTPIKKETTAPVKRAADTSNISTTPTSSGPSRTAINKDRNVVSMVTTKPPIAPRSTPNASATPSLPNLNPSIPNVSQLKPVRPLVAAKPEVNKEAPPPVALRKSENIPLQSNIAAELKMRSPTPLHSSAQLPQSSPLFSSAESVESTPEPDVERALVTFDYVSAGDTEISLVKGDTIIILEKNDSGWWNGQLADGSKGWFPSDFVELIANEGPSIQERLDEVGSKEPRLATPKRAMGKSGRRPPTRGKKAGAAVKSVKTETRDAPADLKNRTTVIGMAPIRLDEGLKLKPTTKSPLSKTDETPPSPAANLKGNLRSTSIPNNNNVQEKEESSPSPRLVTLKKREVNEEKPSSPSASPSIAEKEDAPTRIVALKKRNEVVAEKPAEKEEPTRLVALKKRTPEINNTPTNNTANNNNEDKAVDIKPIQRSSKPDLKNPPRSPRTEAPEVKTPPPRSPRAEEVKLPPRSPRAESSVDPALSTPLPGNLGDFGAFQNALSELFNQCKNKNISGELYPNPILQKANPSAFAVAFQSVSGHKFSLGDAAVPFCLHDAVNPLIYAIGHNEIGKDKISALVGESKIVNENSGFDGKKAANLTTDAASLLISSNLFLNDDAPIRCYQFQQILSALVGPQGVSFDMPTYLTSHHSNDSLLASAYLMGAQNVLGKKKPVKESIDLILQLRSISLNCVSAASLAASLANPQNSPISSNSINAMLNSVKKFGVVSSPSISSISGAIIVILPNIGGLSIYSPLLNNNLVSAKSLELCNSFLSKFNL